MTQLEKATYRLWASLSTCSERTRLSSSRFDRHLGEREARNTIRALADKSVYCFSLSRFNHLFGGGGWVALSLFLQFNRILTSGTRQVDALASRNTHTGNKRKENEMHTQGSRQTMLSVPGSLT